MARAIDHNMASATATTVSGGVKGGILGLLTIPIVGAVIGAVAFAAIPAIVGATSILGTAALLGALVGGITGTAVGAGALPWFAGIGAALGLIGGGGKVGREKAEFQDRLQHHAQDASMGQSAAMTAGMQQGYMTGFQEGQQQVVAQLQQAQEQMLMAQAAQAKEKDCHTCGKHVEALNKERAAQAAAGKQIGA